VWPARGRDGLSRLSLELGISKEISEPAHKKFALRDGSTEIWISGDGKDGRERGKSGSVTLSFPASPRAALSSPSPLALLFSARSLFLPPRLLRRADCSYRCIRSNVVRPVSAVPLRERITREAGSDLIAALHAVAAYISRV